MSYILEALKKAESERKLGSVPNVYMEPLPIAKSEEPASALRRPWIWGAAAMVAVACIAAMWMMKNSQKETVLASPSAAATVVAQAVTLAAPAAKAEARIAAAESGTPQSNKPALQKKADQAEKKNTATKDARPAAPAKTLAEPGKQLSAKAPQPKKESERAPQPENPVARAETDKSDKALAKQPAIAPPPPQTPTPTPQVAALRELPDHIQRSIPPISVGGYIYSPNPAERSMLLNNRLIREGEQAASGVILEKMMPKEAVLSYQGQRFRLSY